MDNDLYFACIDLAGRRCLVVGAGPVGLEKIHGLLAARADVVVVAPEACDEVAALSAAGTVVWHRRPYREGDLDGAFLVVAATSETEVNERVHADAEARTMLVNVADVPHLCNFMLPAIVRDGAVAVAISTKGASPALAQRMRDEAAALFSPAYAELAAILHRLRPWAKEHLPTYQQRKAFFDSIVNGEPDPIASLREGDTDAVERLVRSAKGAALSVVAVPH